MRTPLRHQPEQWPFTWTPPASAFGGYSPPDMEPCVALYHCVCGQRHMCKRGAGHEGECR